MIVYSAFLFVILSIFGAAFTPAEFSRQFCAIELVLLLVFGGIFLSHKIKRNGLICFDTFFVPTYILINYAHAVFIYPDDQFLPAFLFSTRSEVIPYAIAVAQVGIAMYMLASVVFELPGTVRKDFKIELPAWVANRAAYLSALAAFGIAVFIFLINRVQEFIHLYPRLMAAVMSLIALSWYYQAQLLEQNENGIVALLKHNKLNIFATVLFCMSQLYTGSRSEVIFLFFMVILIINTYYVKIKFKVLLPGVIVGVVLMGLLMVTRVSKYSLWQVSLVDSVTYGVKVIMESPNILWMLLTDFVVNAKPLYEAIDYAHLHGYLYGLSYFQYLFVFIPMGGSLFARFVTGQDLVDISSGIVLTYFSGATYGLGINMIGDLYVNLNIVGVCIMMFLLGFLMTRMESPKSKYQYFIYLSLFANCVFLVRADIFSWLNIFVFLFIFDWLLRIRVNVSGIGEKASE